MIRFAIGAFAWIHFTSAALAGGPLEGIELDPTTCPRLTIVDDGYGLECRGAQNFTVVKRGTVGPNVPEGATIRLDWHGAIELGVLPDADTDQIYGYTRELRDGSSGPVVGYISIDAFVNREMESRVKTVTRYNRNGKLIAAKVEELH